MRQFSWKNMARIVFHVKRDMAAVLASAAETFEEAYRNMESIEKRLDVLEQNAAAVSYSEKDRMLEIVPAASSGTGTAEGGDGTDGNE